MYKNYYIISNKVMNYKTNNIKFYIILGIAISSYLINIPYQLVQQNSYVHNFIRITNKESK